MFSINRPCLHFHCLSSNHCRVSIDDVRSPLEGALLLSKRVFASFSSSSSGGKFLFSVTFTPPLRFLLPPCASSPNWCFWLLDPSFSSSSCPRDPVPVHPRDTWIFHPSFFHLFPKHNTRAHARTHKVTHTQTHTHNRWQENKHARSHAQHLFMLLRTPHHSDVLNRAVYVGS